MRFGLGCVIAVGLSLSSAGMADARSKAQAEGFGYVRADGVTLARVKEVEKTLKGCGGLSVSYPPMGEHGRQNAIRTKKNISPSGFGKCAKASGLRLQCGPAPPSPKRHSKDSKASI